ncbi:MAG: hypothetical protein M0Z51_13820 [Propionibacterium sp.]|nr:hypothetical protein [Propionibacterium sp.]
MLRSDRVRSTVVLVFAIAGLGVRFWPGTGVRQVTAAISASGSRLAPAAGAFWIDWLLALSLVVYAVWQARPVQRERAVHRRIAWFAPAIALVDAAWPVLLAASWPLALRLGMVALLLLGLVAVLVVTVHRINTAPDLRHVDLYLLDFTFGLHLGWTTTLSISAVAATVVELGLRPSWWISDVLASLVLLVIGGVVTWWCFWLGDRVAVAVSAAWGLGWIAVERLIGSPHSLVVAIVSSVVALHVLGFTRWRRHTHVGTPVPPPSPTTGSATSAG